MTRNSETLLDVIISNKPELFTECDVFDPQISDHAMVYGVMSVKANHYTYKIVSVRSFKNVNEKKLKEDLQLVPWHIADIFETIDEKYEWWNTQLNSILEEHAPVKRMKVRSRDIPYMTTNWKKATRAKRRYSKPYSKNKTQENFKLMKQWRNEARKERRKAIKNCWKQVAHGQMKSNPRQFYETFMPFLEKKGKENCREGMSLI